MEQSKINNFYKAHPLANFPSCQHISNDEEKEIRSRLKAILGATTDDGKSLVKLIYERANHVEKHNANDDGFDLSKVLADAGVVPAKEIFLNWRQFDDIDRMQFADLVRFFDDLWYPSSDDLDLFDHSASWVLMVAHDGQLRLWTSP